MKTMLEIPDTVFRRAKAKAAEQRIPLRPASWRVSGAVAEKLGTKSAARVRTRMKLAGSLRRLREEAARINRLIEREFERIEPEEWA
jgi:hypothetical protein